MNTSGDKAIVDQRTGSSWTRKRNLERSEVELSQPGHFISAWRKGSATNLVIHARSTDESARLAGRQEISKASRAELLSPPPLA